MVAWGGVAISGSLGWPIVLLNTSAGGGRLETKLVAIILFVWVNVGGRGERFSGEGVVGILDGSAHGSGLGARRPFVIHTGRGRTGRAIRPSCRLRNVENYSNERC